MAERRVTIKIDIDLARNSKQAHAVSIARISRTVGAFATEQMELYGYTVRRSKMQTTLHYVRHVLTHTVKTPKRLAVVRNKAAV